MNTKYVSEKYRSAHPHRQDIQLSVVVPAHNEATRISSTIHELAEWCESAGITYEILIVDNASTDDTAKVAEELSEQFPMVIALSCVQQGKGHAVRLGMLTATGREVMFIDADGATPAGEIANLRAAMNDGVDLAIGSRWHDQTDTSPVKRSFGRSLVSHAFRKLLQIACPLSVADPMCGFKLFRRTAAQALFGRQRLGGWAFDAEILYIAEQLNLSVCEVPIRWNEIPGSTLNLLKDPLNIIMDVWRIPSLHRESD